MRPGASLKPVLQILLAAWLFCPPFTACLLRNTSYEQIRKIPRLKIETPPGTTWLRDSTFIDMTEVRNLDYLEFLYWIGRKEPERYASLLPDTNCIRHQLSYNDPFVNYYLRHPAYRDYPVIGVSYEQAVAYCEWRSDMVNRFIYIRNSKLKFKTVESWDTITHAPVVVHYRLPTREEWEEAAAAGLDEQYFPLGYHQLTDKKGLPVSYTADDYQLFMNTSGYEPVAGEKSLRRMPTTTYPGPVYFGQPNSYFTWNLLGNVSELTADTAVKGYNFLTTSEGIYMGTDSSFVLLPSDKTEKAYYHETFRYTGPQVWLGFRCVCDVLN